MGFHRQSVHLSPLLTTMVGGHSVGTGVGIGSVTREIDTALQSRFRDATSRQGGALIDQRYLSSLEALQNELTDQDLSSSLSAFFNAWSEVANLPEDSAVRSVAIQQGRTLAGRMADLRGDYDILLSEIDTSVSSTVESINTLLDTVANLNGQIGVIEGAGGTASGLRDQRGMILDEIATKVDISVIEQQSGIVDVHIGSIPVVLGADSRGMELRRETVGSTVDLSVRVASDGTLLAPKEGELGALLRQRSETLEPAMEALDEFANALIFEVNKLHSQGQSQQGFTSVVGATGIWDAAAPLNDTAATGLPFPVGNGSFLIHVGQPGADGHQTFQIEVDGDATSLQDIADAINLSATNVTATVGAGARLELSASDGYEFTFSSDSSGALAALGVNTFFEGSDAATIDVRQEIVDDPTLLAVGADHIAGSGGTALAIAGLRDTAADSLNGQSLREYWQGEVNALAVRTDAANISASSASLVADSLHAQVQSISGVSIDEESINLLTYERQFQAAARFISVIDETLQVLLSIA